ncbi:MAG: hypothetical protein WCH31_04440 [Actinomycetes bacterium]
MRRVASLAAVLVVATMLGAAALAADPLDPKVRITTADQAHASAALLLKSDLGPGWSGGERKPDALKIPVCPAYHPNYSDLTITGHAEALYSLDSAGIQIDTDVEVLKSAKQVDSQFARILQPKLPTCLKYDLLKSIGGSGSTFTLVKRLPVPALGTHAAIFRVVIAVKSGSTTVSVFADFGFFAKGRTEFFMNVVAPSTDESQLLPLETRLARTMIGRAKA